MYISSITTFCAYFLISFSGLCPLNFTNGQRQLASVIDIFSIRVFFRRHWGFTGKQGKRGDHLYYSLLLLPAQEHSQSWYHFQYISDIWYIECDSSGSTKDTEGPTQPAFTCSKLTTETLEGIVLVSLLLTLNIFHTLFCFYCQF